MAKAKPQPPKGTRDRLPEELRKRHYVVEVIREVFQRYGFEPLETPAIERLETLSGKYGEEGDQLMFKVLRRGQPLVDGVRRAAQHLAEPGAVLEGRSGETAPGAEPLLADLGLRYDLTVPLARVIAAHQGKLPTVFKRYQIQPVWRADTPGRGRFREFYQCDVDVVGSTSEVVEAEVCAAASECLDRLGFREFALRINHRALLRALIETARIAPERETDALVAIDKLDKVGRDGVVQELRSRGIDAGSAARLITLLGEDPSLSRIHEQLRDHAGGAQAVAQIEAVQQLCAGTIAEKYMRFDATLARGLGYYTGCIFEVTVPDLAGSLGGGGRYDGLIGMFSGKDVPACGFSLGLERILVVMDEQNMYPETLGRPDVAVAPIKENDLPAAFRLAQRLRGEGLKVDLRPKAFKPGKLRQYAEQQAISSVVWLEVGATDKASLWRQGEDATERDVPLELVADYLRSKR